MTAQSWLTIGVIYAIGVICSLRIWRGEEREFVQEVTALWPLALTALLALVAVDVVRATAAGAVAFGGAFWSTLGKRFL
jgi:hypothetical protein